MKAPLSDEDRVRRMHLVPLAIIISLIFIPVRCDASAAPHSIFVSAAAMNMPGEHSHHAESTGTNEPAKSVPHHSPVAADGTMQHHTEADHVMSRTDDPIQQLCSLALTNGNDPESQQPVGAALDLPTTPITPNSATFQPLDTQSTLLLFAQAAVLSGIAFPPDAPPPKLA